MTHKFSSEHMNRLDAEDRRILLAPAATLAELGFRKGMTFADIGCGTGLFTLPAAEISGGSGDIFAIDISVEMLAVVDERAASAGFRNVRTVRSEEYDFNIPDESADFALICTVLHEIDDKVRFLKETARICKPGGKVAVIEFGETLLGYGPPMRDRIPRTVTKRLLEEAGFALESEADIGEAFYAAIGIKLS